MFFRQRGAGSFNIHPGQRNHGSLDLFDTGEPSAFEGFHERDWVQLGLAEPMPCPMPETSSHTGRLKVTDSAGRLRVSRLLARGRGSGERGLRGSSHRFLPAFSAHFSQIVVAPTFGRRFPG